LSPDGVSLSEYTYVLTALASAYVPGARTALVLGLGAGVVPRELSDRGLAVDAVEINPDMAAAARAYVTPDPAWSTHIADARTFVRDCSRPYDLVVIDLFHGDGTPDYLLSADFFASLRRCLGPDGAAIMNAFASDRASAGYRHLLATVQSVFPAVVDFHRPAGEGELNFNAYVVALAEPRPPGPVLLREVPELLHPGLAATLDSASGDTAIGDAAPVTDEHNIFSILNLDDQLAYRRLIVPQLPPAMLVN
jgi:SAM-dependent methyltransferase